MASTQVWNRFQFETSGINENDHEFFNISNSHHDVRYISLPKVFESKPFSYAIDAGSGRGGSRVPQPQACLAPCIHQMVWESQLPHKIVNLLFTISLLHNKLTMLWGSWLSKTIYLYILSDETARGSQNWNHRRPFERHSVLILAAICVLWEPFVH